MVVAEQIPSAVNKAVTVINQGGVVAFPTETFYGLAVDPFNEKALDHLFRLKNRSPAKPVLTLVADENQLNRLAADIPSFYPALMRQFWPGPLTLLFPALASLPWLLTADTGRVGARISSHPVAQTLVRGCGRPITATSANLAGCPAATSAAEVLYQLPQVDFIIEFDKFVQGTASTIIGSKDGDPEIIRPGVFLTAEILKAL